jgi:hypothetical protein
MTIVNVTTVGYGDFTPKTDVGRMIGCICVTWGVLNTSILVVVLTNTFSLNRSIVFINERLMAILEPVKKIVE